MKIDSLSPDKIIFKEIGKRLRQIRKQQGYSQDKLAKKAGLGIATLRRIEDGHDSQLGSWLKILKALQMVHLINDFLPENFSSPMAETLAQRKTSRSKYHSPSPSSPSFIAEKAVWGDEKS